MLWGATAFQPTIHEQSVVEVQMIHSVGGADPLYIPMPIFNKKSHQAQAEQWFKQKISLFTKTIKVEFFV